MMIKKPFLEEKSLLLVQIDFASEFANLYKVVSTLQFP